MTVSLGDIAQVVIALLWVVNFFQNRRNSQNIQQIHLATNSMKDELVKVTGEANFAAGIKQAEDAQVLAKVRDNATPN